MSTNPSSPIVDETTRLSQLCFCVVYGPTEENARCEECRGPIGMKRAKKIIYQRGREQNNPVVQEVS